MKTKIFLLLILSSTSLFSQVGIGTDNAHVSSMLELKSSNKGFLIPSLTTTQRNAITLPAEGLTIYNETTKCIEFNISTDGSHDWKNTCNDSNSNPSFPNPVSVSVSRNLENRTVDLNTK